MSVRSKKKNFVFAHSIAFGGTKLVYKHEIHVDDDDTSDNKCGDSILQANIAYVKVNSAFRDLE